ncbi:hypothetical protein GCM10011349_18490 [Novosphingobium indicum]|uniref:Histidine kinase/HSP90-like ATPase domain-containing protein n=1 Tax=Novosphingobium indicum TaxID=462949 RepID=A0ABQ2JK84_9SPHN|nr:ATP-binding protein [Novosphingobium indicum]GGN48627.1 hypothetical protein GCM10011349_18490 [Novosphingobium indicum]
MMPSPDLPSGISVAANLMEVRRLAEHLRMACADKAIDELTTFDCELALVEAANNVVEHGYQGRPEGELTLIVQIAGSTIRMELLDRGTPVPDGQFLRCETVPPDATHGRGTGIIQSCMDGIEYTSENGLNRLVMTKRLP